MKTDDLILQLAASATPVTPLPPPRVRMWRWIAGATMAAAVVVVGVGPRADLATALTRPVYLASLCALVLAAISAASTALAMSVPGAERSTRARALPIAAVAAWALLWLLLIATRPAGHARLLHAGCVIQITVISALSGWLLIAMLRRAAPLQPGWTAGIAAIAAVTLGAAATQLMCPIDDAAHQLVGHVLTAAVVGLSAALVGRGPLTLRRRPTPRP